MSNVKDVACITEPREEFLPEVHLSALWNLFATFSKYTPCPARAKLERSWCIYLGAQEPGDGGDLTWTSERLTT